jgi:hypothetical protein
MTQLSRLNGWQRLWFAGTILALIIFGLIYPVIELGKNRSFTYRWSIQKDYNNPVCSRFLNQPFEQLQEPPSGDDGTCWHIYISRKYAVNHEAFRTYEAWISNDDKEYWLRVAMYGAIMAVVVLLVSAIVYALGKTVAWIRRGFANQT